MPYLHNAVLKMPPVAPQPTPEDATVNLNATSWKSTISLLIMDVSGGTVTVGNETYNVHFGYAMVAPQHGLRIMALVSSGNSLGMLALTGKPSAEGTTSYGAMNGNGFTIGLTFGNGEPNKLKTMTDTWDLDLTGTVHASITKA